MRNGQHKQDDLPKWLWLVAAPAILPMIILSRYVDIDFYQRWIDSETGFTEVATPLLLLGAIIAGLMIGGRFALLPEKWLGLWFVLLALGSFYFAGEEISWGQHFFNWQTPEPIAALNDQGETNLHNMSSWFDQKPRLLVVLGAIIGGAIAPFLMMLGKLSPGSPSHWRYWILPRRECIIPGLMVALVRIPEDVLGSFGKTAPFPFDIRASEVQELYMAMFLCFYAISAWRRLERLRAGQ